MSFPRYERYKDSGVEWLGEVPEGWEVLQGRRLFSQKRDPSLPEDEQLSATQKYGVVPQRLFMELEDQKVTLALSGLENFKHVEQDDFVISLRSFQGGIERSQYAGCVSPAYTVLRANQPICGAYWAPILKSSEYIAALQSVTDGIRDGKNISYEQFGQIALPIPPLPEQQTIAAFLDCETGKIDALVAEQERLIALLKEKRQAVISHAVTKGLNPDTPLKDSGVEWLGEVPLHWEITRIKYLTTDEGGIQMGPFGGMLLDLETTDTGYKVYGQENTISGDFSLGSRWISKERFDDLKRYQLRDGDLVLTRKGSIGNARLICGLAQLGIADSDTIRLRANDKRVLPQFLELLLHSTRYVAEQLELTKRGAILTGLNTETIANIIVILPSIVEQLSVMNWLALRTKEFDDCICESENSVAFLKERRSALISAAVTGKIDVRHTEAA